MKALHLAKLHDLDFGGPIADLGFVDEERVVFSTPTGDVRTAGVDAGRQPSELLIPWRDFRVGDPGLGTFVYIEVSPGRDLLALNPTDLAIDTFPLDGSEPLRRVHAELNEFDPILRFSPDGAFLTAETAETLHLFDLRGRRTTALGDGILVAWHPSRSRLLALDGKTLRWSDAATRRSTRLGAIDLAANVWAMMPREDGAECVFACCDDTLEWWAIDPPRRLAALPAGGEVIGLTPSPDRRLMAVLQEDGCRLWDAARREPLGDTLPGMASVAFSPSGRRLIACWDANLEYPGNERTPSLWEIRESPPVFPAPRSPSPGAAAHGDDSPRPSTMMPELVHLHDLDFGMSVHDAVFVDEERILFSAAGGEIRSAVLRPGRIDSARLFDCGEALDLLRREVARRDTFSAPVASLLGRVGVFPRVTWAPGADRVRGEEPWGLHPRLAVSTTVNRVALNTEGNVVLTVPLGAGGPPRLHVVGADDTLPVLRFSADGQWLASQSRRLHLVEIHGGEAVELLVIASDWHRSKPLRLALQEGGSLAWVNPENGAVRTLGPAEAEGRRGEVSGLAVTAGAAECVIAVQPDRLEWWALETPPRLVDVRPAAGGAVAEPIASPDGRRIATVSDGGFELWDARTRARLCDPVPRVVAAAFSPSGRKLILMAVPEEDPAGGDLLVSLREIREPGAEP